MGVSQWLNHGDKNGYSEYFWDREKKKIIEMIDETMMTKKQGYYCTEEHLGYHDKNCEWCEWNASLLYLKKKILKS